MKTITNPKAIGGLDWSGQMLASAGRSCIALELSISAFSSDETRKQEKRYHVMAGGEGGKVKQSNATCRIHICFDRAAPSRAVRVA
jgi:hypothetical protein